MRIDSPEAISDALAKGMEEGGLLLSEADLAPTFYDLASGLAGELFQKFVNYRVPLALVIKDPAVHGERFVELAREHRDPFNGADLSGSRCGKPRSGSL